MLFNHRCATVVDNRPLAAVPDMSATEYQPEGGTALWDGIGSMIEIVGQRFDNAPTPPRVLIVIITDGEETSSSHYTLPHVRELIAHRQKVCGWSFIVVLAQAAELGRQPGFQANATHLELAYRVHRILVAASKGGLAISRGVDRKATRRFVDEVFFATQFLDEDVHSKAKARASRIPAQLENDAATRMSAHCMTWQIPS